MGILYVWLAVGVVYPGVLSWVYDPLPVTVIMVTCVVEVACVNEKTDAAKNRAINIETIFLFIVFTFYSP